MPDEVIPVPMMSTSEMEQQIAELKKKNDELAHALYKQTKAYSARGELIQALYRAAFFIQSLGILAFIETRANECNVELPNFLGFDKKNRFDANEVEVVNVVLAGEALGLDRVAIGAEARESIKKVLTKFTEG